MDIQKLLEGVGRWDRDAGDHLSDSQEKALRKRLFQYSEHPLFKKYGLSVEMSRKDFLKACPVISVDETQNLFLDQSFVPAWVTKGYVDAFALSSGTSAAKRKIYPITSEFLCHFEDFKILGAAVALGWVTSPEDLARPVLTVTAQRGSDTHAGLPVMPLSWYMNVGKGTEIPENSPFVHYSQIFHGDFSVRDDVTWESLRALDLGSIAAMPPYVLAMYEGLQKRFGLESFRDVWPHLSLYRLFGFSRGPYMSRLETIFGSRLKILELYVASEGVFGLQRTEDDPSLQIIPSEVVFFFMDVENQALYLPEETEVGKVYSLVVTTPSGCLFYAMGDSIRVTHKSPFRFVFAERTDESLRIGTEIMSLSDFSSWINEAKQVIEKEIGAFIVAPNSERTGHSLIIETTGGTSAANPSKHLSQLLDQLMTRDNIYYRNQRRSGFMKPPEIYCADLGTLDKILIRSETIGQGKYKRVFNDRNALEKVLNSVTLF